MSDIFDTLRHISEEREKGSPHPLYMKNADYYLCFDERYLLSFVRLWDNCYRPFPIQLRNASKGVEHCAVAVIRDRDGEMIDFITEAVAETKARVEVRHRV